MQVRRRLPADFDPCLELLAAVHTFDGYPGRWPRDVRRFLAPSHELHAWVADRDGAVAGHIALHDPAVDPVLEAAMTATGLTADQLAVVARLFISPTVRRDGVGRALLAAAELQARAEGRRPILDVAKQLAGAVAFYDASRWPCLGESTLTFSDGTKLDVWIYTAPGR